MKCEICNKSSVTYKVAIVKDFPRICCPTCAYEHEDKARKAYKEPSNEWERDFRRAVDKEYNDYEHRRYR